MQELWERRFQAVKIGIQIRRWLPNMIEILTELGVDFVQVPFHIMNPPIVAEYGITHALKFTVNTDKAHYKQAVESDYAGGDINVHFHWTKSTINSDQSTKNVKWQLKYLVINGTSENCNSGESTDSIGDTYDSAVNATQIIYKTGDITIPNGIFEIHDMIIMEVMAVTPTPDALSDEPALVYFDIVYTAKHRP